MRAVWSAGLPEQFTVRDAQRLVPDLAYTTVMTTLGRLAHKGLLDATRPRTSRAIHYRAAGSPTAYLLDLSRRQAQLLRKRFGDRALAAFAAELDDLSTEELERLRRLAAQ